MLMKRRVRGMSIEAGMYGVGRITKMRRVLMIKRIILIMGIMKMIGKPRTLF